MSAISGQTAGTNWPTFFRKPMGTLGPGVTKVKKIDFFHSRFETLCSKLEFFFEF